MVQILNENLQRKKDTRLDIARTTLTVSEVAQYIGVCEDTIYNMVREKQIPHVRARRRIFFRRDSIDTWMARQEIAVMKDGETP